MATGHGVGEGASALASLLKRSPVMLPVPGTGDPSHLADSIMAATALLEADAFELFDRQCMEARKRGETQE